MDAQAASKRQCEAQVGGSSQCKKANKQNEDIDGIPTTSTIKSNQSPQFEAVGGHDDSIAFEGSIVWKKVQGGGRGDSETEFIQKAAGIPGLCNFVPKYHGLRNMGNSRYLGMTNLLAGLAEPAIIDLKMGTQTWSPSASAEKIASQSKKAAKSTTGKIGVRLVGGKLRLAPGGEWVRVGYKNDQELASEVELTQELGRFLCSPGLRAQAVVELERLNDWFSSQTEFAFYASSLLLAYDTAELPNPKELRFGMIDFSHVEPPPEGGDQSYMTGLQSMRRMFANLTRK